MVTRTFLKMMIYLTIAVFSVNYLLEYPTKEITQLSELGLQYID